MKKAKFSTEADLCATFLADVPDGWTAYAETAGFDIVLVRAADGCQIGIEAKLSLNAKVILQSLEHEGHYHNGTGPDFRAALVPYGAASGEMQAIARRLGITVVQVKSDELYDEYERRYGSKRFSPELPLLGKHEWREIWVDQCPVTRCKLPEYIPDVTAGCSSPVQLSDWKIKAIKIAIILERRGWLSMADFKHVQIDRKRWLDMRWLALSDVRGKYVPGLRPLDLRRQHPVNYEQISSDYDKWAPTVTTEPLKQEVLAL